MRFHIVCAFLLILSFSCFSQTTETHNILKYTQNEGLSSYNVRSIIQDPKGFTWIATQDGLSLFDGKTFIKYTNNSEPNKKIAGSDVRCVALDTLRSILWVLNSYGTINAIDYSTGNVARTVNSNAVNNDDWCSSMVRCNDRLWISCQNGLKIYNTEKNIWEQPPVIPFNLNRNRDFFFIEHICLDLKGNIWAFINHYGIMIINPHSKLVIRTISTTEITRGHEADELNFLSVANIDTNRLLIGTSHGLKLIEYTGFKIACLPGLPALMNFLKQSKIGAIVKSGNYLYVANDNNLFRFNKQLTHYVIIRESNTKNTDRWLNDIQNLYIDGDDNLWLGCKRGIAYLSHQPSPFNAFSNKGVDKYVLNHVYSLLKLRGGDILTGLENGLLRYHTSSNSFTQIDHSKYVNYLFYDSHGNVVVSTDRGLYILQRGRLVRAASIYPELRKIANCSVNSFIKLGDSLLVLGTENEHGILLWNYKKRRTTFIDNSSTPVKLRSNIINRIFKDSKGRIWVLSDFGIDILSPDLKTIKYLSLKVPAAQEKLKLYFDISEIHKQFWLACYSFGIAELDFSGNIIKMLSTREGLCNDGVYRLFQSGDSKLIITTNDGLSEMDTRKLSFRNYYEHDGLHANAFEENCADSYNHKIVAGGINGFTDIDPALLSENQTAPRLYFNKITILTTTKNIETRNINITELTIPSNALQTTISFSALNYVNPSRVAYRYKLDGINEKWIPLGSQNFVNLIGLAPGTIPLLVESANENGIWNKNPAKLNLTFLPKWYQTWLFKILAFLTVAAFVYAAFAYRIRQLQQQQQIRRAISNDLHDDLGGTLNSIKMFAHLAISQPQNNAYLQEIEESVTSATAGLRDILWVLDGANDNLDELMERVIKFALPIANAKAIKFESHIDEGLKAHVISKTEKKNLLLIFKESANNCFKYSDCTIITLNFQQNRKNKLVLVLSDNGAGFDTKQQLAGYGLKNIQYRATQINYTASINSSPGKGTTLTLQEK